LRRTCTQFPLANILLVLIRVRVDVGVSDGVNVGVRVRVTVCFRVWKGQIHIALYTTSWKKCI
jgi:hypothetical protein